MRVLRSKRDVRNALRRPRASGDRIGLVPTMGSLHDGHLALLRMARERCDVVVMSLFVNPTQFRPGEDFAGYPRNEERDIALASDVGVDLIFAPEADEMLDPDRATTVRVEGLSEVLCGDPGRRGPEHFEGVTTIVAKLFNIVQPDLAFFGQKDAQQAVLVRRMIRDLDFPIELVVLPTVRDAEGLAFSSRNAYLSPSDRDRATGLSRALEAATESLAGGDGLETALAAARGVLAEAGIEPEYLEARDAETLEPLESLDGRRALIAVAAPVGSARLIDNVVVEQDARDAGSAQHLQSEIEERVR